MKESDEFLVLQKYFKNLGSQYNDSSGILLGPGDDAGLFTAKKNDLIFSTDVSNSDVHFPKDLAPEHIAFRSCAVAASDCLLYTSPSPRDATLSRMPSSA